MRHSKVFMFALLCVCSLGSHKELAPGSPMGTKIHAYTSPWYRVASYSWPFITMGSILQSTVGSIYGCGTHAYRGLSIMFYFLTLSAFNVFSFISVFSGLNICFFLLTFTLLRHQWLLDSLLVFILHYYWKTTTVISSKFSCVLFTFSSFSRLPITYVSAQYFFSVCAFSVSSAVSDSLRPHGL